MSGCVSPGVISSSTTGLRTTSNAQLRKIKKPLIERRRRERINECLIQLKTLVLEAMNKDESRYSKMEKADILEMTVLHLKSIQQRMSPPSSRASPCKQQQQLQTTIPSQADHHHQQLSLGRYLVGFSECAQEVSQYLTQTGRGNGENVRHRVMTHLSNCLETLSPTSALEEQERKLPLAVKVDVTRTNTASGVLDCNLLQRYQETKDIKPLKSFNYIPCRLDRPAIDLSPSPSTLHDAFEGGVQNLPTAYNKSTVVFSRSDSFGSARNGQVLIPVVCQDNSRIMLSVSKTASRPSLNSMCVGDVTVANCDSELFPVLQQPGRNENRSCLPSALFINGCDSFKTDVWRPW